MILRKLRLLERLVHHGPRYYATRNSPYDDPNYTPKDAPITVDDEPSQVDRMRDRMKKMAEMGDFLRPQNEPWSLNYPGPRGEVEVDHDITLLERLPMTGRYVVAESRKWLQEVKEEYWTNDIVHGHRPIHHGEIRQMFTFDAEDSLKDWQHGSDAGVDEGFSTCQLRRTESGTALMSGVLDTEVPKTGEIRQAGWASMKTKNKQKSFQRQEYHRSDMDGFTHLVIRCRGDGRTYMLNLGTPDDWMDITWGNMHRYPLYTHGGPYWQTYIVPFSKFYKCAAGKIAKQPRHGIGQTLEVRSFGITLMDRRDGPFTLEVDYIGCYYDMTHWEKNAYEFYQFPTGVAAFTRC